MSNVYTVQQSDLSDDAEYFQTWIKGLLHDTSINNLRITFTKTDGSARTIRCTLVEDNIPIDQHPKGTGRTIADATQRVFDLDKQQWRSFRWDSVTEVAFDLGS